MKLQIRLIFIVILFFISIGCATTRQYVPFPDQSKKIENPDLGRVYLFRPSVFGFAIPMQIYDSNKVIGDTGPKGYLCWEREPGKTKIAGLAENKSELPLEVNRGKVYYIFQHMRLGWFRARNKLELVDEIVAREYLQDCKAPEVIEKDK